MVMLLVISGLEKNMKALILIAILIGAPFLIQSANALLIDIRPLCLSEAMQTLDSSFLLHYGSEHDQQLQECIILLNITNATAICQHMLPGEPNLQ